MAYVSLRALIVLAICWACTSFASYRHEIPSTTTWSLDGAGRIVQRKIQDGSAERNSYDLEGRRLSHTTFAGETLTEQYDAQGQRIAQSVPRGAGTNSAVPPGSVRYTYTPSGQIASQQEQGATTLEGTQSHRYDAADRLIHSTSPLGELSYSLDSAGNPVERSVSNASADAGTTKATYDAAGRLSSVTAPDGKQTRYAYDAAGRLILTERDLKPQAGQTQVLRTHHRYDSADRVVAIAHVKHSAAGQTLMAGQALSRSAGGTIQRMETYRASDGAPSFDAPSGVFSGTASSTQSFEYDANARLTRESRMDAAIPTQSSDTRYEYDAVGNRTTKTRSTGAVPAITTVTTYSYDSADRLTQESTSAGGAAPLITTYQWDGNGNLAARQEPGKTTLYRFDPQSRLIDMRTGATPAQASAAAPEITYAYDAAGNRVRKTLKTNASPDRVDVSSYLIDSSHSYPQVALESTRTVAGTASPATQSTAYLWGNQLIRQTRGGAGTLFAGADPADDLFPLQGHLNTSLGALDADGNLVEQAQGDAFGLLDAATGLRQSHLYTGEYWDQDSQLLYLRARWYEPRSGRFISADPFEGRQRDPRSLNRYAYAQNDPVHKVDRLGLTSTMDVGVSLNINAINVSAAVVAIGAAPLLYPSANNAVLSTIWDLMVYNKISHQVPEAATIAMAKAKEKAEIKIHKDGEAHHTVPKYLCGNDNQNKSRLTYLQHQVVHAGLGAVLISIEASGDSVATALNIPLGRQRHPVIQALGRTELGRTGISSAIEALYDVLPGVNETYGILPIGVVFPPEKQRFINGHRHPLCM